MFGLPDIGITGFTGISLSNTIGRFNVQQIHEFSESLSVNKGRHNFKLGGVYRYNSLDSVSGNLPRGSLSFTRDIVGIPDGMAAFMLGYPTNHRESFAPSLSPMGKREPSTACSSPCWCQIPAFERS